MYISSIISIVWLTHSIVVVLKILYLQQVLIFKLENTDKLMILSVHKIAINNVINCLS